jgi:hypothetical protein
VEREMAQHVGDTVPFLAHATSLGCVAVGACVHVGWAVPTQVLETARDDMMDWHGCGMSVMELSHRGAEFGSIIAEAEKSLRE